MTNKPRIRFKGFDEEWKRTNVGNLAGRTFGGGTPKTNVEEYWGGDIPWIQSSNLLEHQMFNIDIRKYITKEGLQKSAAQLVPGNSIAVVSHVGVGKLLFIPFEYTSSQDFISLSELKSEPIFTCYALYKRLQEDLHIVQGSAIKGITKEDLLNKTLAIPCDKEQLKIGSMLKNIDRLITLNQRKLESLKQCKKYMLSKMFPKEGETVPKIRFEGFTGGWEQRKLGKLYQRNTERNENLIGYDKTISVATMSYKDDGNGASESSLSTYKVLRVGDIAFEGHTNKQFRFGRFVVNDIGTGIMSPRFSALRPLNEMPVNFWKQYIHSESVIRRILVKSTKAGTMMNELVIPEFLNQTIMVPSKNEQAVIGQYFASLDNLINLHQRKLDSLKEFKKYMLQNMFPSAD